MNTSEILEQKILTKEEEIFFAQNKNKDFTEYVFSTITDSNLGNIFHNPSDCSSGKTFAVRDSIIKLLRKQKNDFNVYFKNIVIAVEDYKVMEEQMEEFEKILTKEEYEEWIHAIISPLNDDFDICVLPKKKKKIKWDARRNIDYSYNCAKCDLCGRMKNLKDIVEEKKKGIIFMTHDQLRYNFQKIKDVVKLVIIDERFFKSLIHRIRFRFDDVRKNLEFIQRKKKGKYIFHPTNFVRVLLETTAHALFHRDLDRINLKQYLKKEYDDIDNDTLLRLETFYTKDDDLTLEELVQKYAIDDIEKLRKEIQEYEIKVKDFKTPSYIKYKKIRSYSKHFAKFLKDEKEIVSDIKFILPMILNCWNYAKGNIEKYKQCFQIIEREHESDVIEAGYIIDFFNNNNYSTLILDGTTSTDFYQKAFNIEIERLENNISISDNVFIYALKERSGTLSKNALRRNNYKMLNEWSSIIGLHIQNNTIPCTLIAVQKEFINKVNDRLMRKQFLTKRQYELINYWGRETKATNDYSYFRKLIMFGASFSNVGELEILTKYYTDLKKEDFQKLFCQDDMLQLIERLRIRIAEILEDFDCKEIIILSSIVPEQLEYRTKRFSKTEMREFLIGLAKEREEVIKVLRNNPDGLTNIEIRNKVRVCSNNKISKAIKELEEDGVSLVRKEKKEGICKPIKRYYLNPVIEKGRGF